MKEKINNIELISILFLILFSCTLGIAPYITIRMASIDAYIGVLIGNIIGIIPLLIFLYIFNYESDKPIYVKIRKELGKYFGTFINMMMLIIYLIMAMSTLFNISNFIISQYLTDTPIALIIIIFSFTAYHTLNKGIKTVSKISLIYVIIIIILFTLATIGLVPKIELDNLKPVLEYGIKKPMVAGIIYSIVMSTPIYGILVIPKKDINNYHKSTKYIVITYLVTVSMIGFMAFVASTCLGKYLLSMYQYPVYTTLKKISIFGFIDRIENFLSIQWILSIFIAFVIQIINIQNIVNMKNNKIINLIIVMIVVGMTMKLFKNNTSFNYYILNTYPYVLLILFGIYFIIFIIFVIRGIKRKK